MPRLPIPGSDEGTWGDILNAYLQAAHNADGSLKNNTVSASKIQDATISEAKLDTALAAKVNSVAGDPTMGGDLSGTASNAQIAAGAVGTTELASNAVTTAKITDANVTTAKIADSNVTTAKLNNAAVTAAKLATAAGPTSGQLLSYNGTALNWTDPTTVPADLGDLGDVTTTGATDGQSLVYQSGSGTWIPATVTSGGGVTDHGALTGLSDDDHPQYHNDARGDARYYTQSQVDTALSGKSDTSHSHTLNSLSDVNTAGVSTGDVLKYDGANWVADTDLNGGAGDPSMGGDLSGTASNAQIVAGAVDTTELAAGAVTDAKVASGIAQSKITNLTSDLASKASTTHTHAGADITSGTVGTARLGSGTANSTTYLRGDGTWATPSGGSSSHGMPLIVAASNAPTTIKNDADYVCDGTADQVQINTAISQAAYTDNGGIAWGQVLLTGGEFAISAPIEMKTGVTLQGSGFLTILKSDGLSAPSGVVELYDLNTHLTTLSHLTIDGGAAGGGTSSAVVYRNSNGNIGDPKGATGDHSGIPGNDPDSSHVISDLFVRNFGNGTDRHGIFMDADARDPKVSRVRVKGNSGTGFKMNDSSDGKYSQCIAIGCNIGWEVGGGSNMFTTCKAAYSTVDGWSISSSRIHMVGCHAQDNGRHGFNVTGVDPALTGCVADSNRRLDTAGYALYLTSDRAMIEGLHAYDRGQSAQQQTQGINFVGCSDVYVTANIRLPSGSTFTNGSPGGNSFVRVVRVGSTVYSVG
ncbi:TPA: hypothetical protein DIV49_02765 [Candidatus Saccharibacteria bacterium]|nr:hypothetical protein [Candidatus Saccharibacteria bacterium]HRJ91029.1 hypothetical protein [Candidatus Saccharibacteria bacterium]